MDVVKDKVHFGWAGEREARIFQKQQQEELERSQSQRNRDVVNEHGE